MARLSGKQSKGKRERVHFNSRMVGSNDNHVKVTCTSTKKRATTTVTIDDNRNVVARHNFEFIKMPTKAEADAAIAKVRKQWPMLTFVEACRLHCLRSLAEVGMRYSNSSGGGKYPEFVHYLAAKYKIDLRF